MMNFEEIVSNIEAMRLQEELGYRCKDYLHQEQPPVVSSLSCLPQQSNPIDADCRLKMAQWSYQIVDYCKFNRETVAISLSYLDRYLCTPAGRQALENRTVFQLAAMTSLYTAVKIHEPEALEPKVVAQLSRGTYTEQQVLDMEISMLMALEWRMNPPTAVSFANNFFALLDESCSLSDAEKCAAFEVAKFQTELAAIEYDLVSVAPSAIGLAAVLNAIESISPAKEMHIRQYLCKTLNSLVGLDVTDVQKKLLGMIGTNLTRTMRPNYLAPRKPAGKKFLPSRRSEVGSPRCVAHNQ